MAFGDFGIPRTLANTSDHFLKVEHAKLVTGLMLKMTRQESPRRWSGFMIFFLPFVRRRAQRASEVEGHAIEVKGQATGKERESERKEGGR